MPLVESIVCESPVGEIVNLSDVGFQCSSSNVNRMLIMGLNPVGVIQ